jgi:DNA-binding NarL/FixJ family response regulator
MLHSIIVPPEDVKKRERALRERCNSQLRKWGLTARQAEVASYLLEGRTNKEIADDLCVVVKTIKFHFTCIFLKMGVKNRTQALGKINSIMWRLK